MVGKKGVGERMPIYKIYRSGVEERRNRRALARWRWVAVAVSVVLLAVAATMLMFAPH